MEACLRPQVSCRLINDNHQVGWLVGWLIVFYGMSIFENYSMPNPFLYK